MVTSGGLGLGLQNLVLFTSLANIRITVLGCTEKPARTKIKVADLADHFAKLTETDGFNEEFKVIYSCFFKVYVGLTSTDLRRQTIH